MLNSSLNLDDPCLDQNQGRQRPFWATHQDVCGQYTLCGVPCTLPGLEYEDTNDGRTIKTDEWLKGLILNILNTRARTDAKCPSPAAVYGHWSESYRGDNLHIGTRLWNAAEKAYTRIGDAVKAIEAAVRADVSKLIALGLVDKVHVETVYVGHARVDVLVTTQTLNRRQVLNLSGAFTSGAGAGAVSPSGAASASSGTWVWH